MKLAINEIKVQAKLLLKSINNQENLPKRTLLLIKKLAIGNNNELQLKHCLNIVSQLHGFKNWQHAHKVLSGKLDIEESYDFGELFHNNRCDALINLWFSTYDEAKNALTSKQENAWLVPYRRQFIVVNSEFIKLLNIPSQSKALKGLTNRDFYESYNSIAWDELAYEVIRNKQ